MPTWRPRRPTSRSREAVLKQAENEKAAGTGTGIEITRAKVQLANDRQRLLVAQNARRSAHLQLLRAIGLRLDTELELTDKLHYVPVDAVTLEQAKAQALKERPDLKAQQEREANARLSASATKLERLPSVAAFGDYGVDRHRRSTTRCPPAPTESRCGCRSSTAAGATRGARNRRRSTAPRRCAPTT